MKVTILASTVMNDGVMEAAYDYDPYNVDDTQSVWLPTEADALAEAAGRICYLSFNRPNPATSHNGPYLRNIIKQGHFSVLEHASVTFLVQDVSRALLAELSRHRHLSFSVVSQRFVDYAKTKPVIPPALADDANAVEIIQSSYAEAVLDYQVLTMKLLQAGLTRKAAREAARAVLPNAAPVDMVVTGNLRAWRDVLGKRHAAGADAEIQQFAGLVLKNLRTVAPHSVQDITDEVSQ